MPEYRQFADQLMERGYAEGEDGFFMMAEEVLQTLENYPGLIIAKHSPTSWPRVLRR